MSKNIKVDISEYIKSRSSDVTFVELEKFITGFSGDQELYVMENIVIWQGISAEAIEALNELMRDKIITPTPTNVLNYFADGKIINLPLPKKYKSYKSPRWVPVVFSYTKKDV